MFHVPLVGNRWFRLLLTIFLLVIRSRPEPARVADHTCPGLHLLLRVDGQKIDALWCPASQKIEANIRF